MKVEFPQAYLDELKTWIAPKVGDRCIAWGKERVCTYVSENGARCSFDTGYQNIGIYEGVNWRNIKVL